MRTGILICLTIMAAAPGFAPAAGPEDAVAPVTWEYKTLTRIQVAQLSQNDFEAGLNRLGAEGWELVAVDAAQQLRPAEYIFKRPKGQIATRINDLRGKLKVAQADVEIQKDRIAWAERAAAKASLSDAQLKAERARLTSLEADLEKLRKDLEALMPAARDHKPEDR